MIDIALLNQSTIVTLPEVMALRESLNIQLDDHFSPAWDIGGYVNIIAGTHAKSKSQWLLVLLDDADQADALGYHELTSDGQPLGKVFVKTTVAANESWTVCASHELLEMLVDPYCDLCAQNSDGTIYSYEVCDPCQDDAMGYKIGDVLVSDFTLPAWFTPNSAAPYDFMQKLTAAFKLGEGGYTSTFVNGSWGQQFGARAKTSDMLIIPGSRRDRRIKRHRSW